MPTALRPRELLNVVFRHKKKAILTFLCLFAAAVALTALMRPRYRSEAMLYVRLGRENVALDPTASIGGGSVVAIPHAREDEINSVVEMLKSRSLAERVVEHLGPETILGAQPETEETAPSLFDWAVEQLGPLGRYVQRLSPDPPLTPEQAAEETLINRLTVWAPKRSTVVFISFDGPSPEAAQAVVKQLIELYLEEHVRLNRTAGSHDFFVEQTQEIRQRLNDAEARMRDLKNRTGMASIEDQRKILVERIGRLQDDVLTDGAELKALEAELAALNDKLDKLPETRVIQRVSGLPNQAADLMRQQLYALQLKEQEYLTIYKEDAFQVKEIRRQIQEARAILAKEEYDRTQSTNSADPTFQQLHLSLHSKQTVAASLRARLAKSEEQLAAAKSELAQLNDYELQIAQLRREVELQEANYRKYAENLELARIDQALKLERISNIAIAQPASYQPQKVRPRTAMQLAVGLLASLMSGIGIAFAAEYCDRSIRSPQEMEAALELAPLVCVPRLTDTLVKVPAARETHAHAIAR